MKFVFMFIAVVACAVIGAILGEGLLSVLAFLCCVAIGAILCSVGFDAFYWPMLPVALVSALFLGQALAGGTASLGLVIGGMAFGAIAALVYGYVYASKSVEEEEDVLNQIEN